MAKTKEQKRLEAGWRAARYALPGKQSTLRSEEKLYPQQRTERALVWLQRAKAEFWDTLKNIGPVPLHEVVADAARCESGRIEVAPAGPAAEAVALAARCGYLNIVGNGVASITYEGHEFLRQYPAPR